MASLIKSLVNGNPADHIALQDRGLAYGHGLFETITLNNGSAIHWLQHMQRLQLGAGRLGIPCDQRLIAQLDSDLQLLLAEQLSAPSRQVLKIILTRGEGGRGYAVSSDMAVTRILMLSDFPDYPDQPASNGIRIHLCKTRLSRNPQLAGIKHLNRLEQVLARAEWDDSDIREGLVCDSSGNLVEGTMSNLFWVTDGELYTPDLTQAGVAGVIRQRIIELAGDYSIPLHEVCADLSVLQSCDELFLSNSVIGIWPVVSCTDKQLSREWQIGNITRQLQQLLAAEGI
ncbi:aminodeoxychorismate lyase [Amphritea sp. HPY]|uniref:aminodeoxychorismate lyase n=1 Tax=Amphritea sp. HPY TaxID=3421652 RepID=UPI003D7DBD2D